MRLVFIYEFQNMSGGMSHSVKEMIQGLKREFPVLIISPESAEVQNFAATAGIQHVETQPSLWHLSFKNPFNSAVRTIALQSKIKHQLKPGDILITNGLLPEFICGAFCRLHQWKRIFFVRGEVGKSKLWRLLSFSGIQRVICVSSFSHTLFTKHFPKLESKAIILNNPVAEIAGMTPRETSDGRLVIGCAGFFHPDKNQGMLLRIIPELLKKGIQAHANLYGQAASPVDEKYLSELKKYVTENKIESHVTFRGYCEKQIMFSEIDVMLSCSKVEGFGKTLVEGMSCGVPVVAFASAGGPADIIENEVNGLLLDKHDDCALTEALVKLAREPQFKARLVANGLVAAKNKFSQETWLSEFKAILKDTSTN